MRTLLAATALATLLAASPAFAQNAASPDATKPAATPVAPATTDTMKPEMPATATDTTKAPVTDATKQAAAPTERFITTQAMDDWLASKLIGSSIYDPADEKLGDVNDVVATSDGQVKAIVVGVGGFLGIGEKNVAVTPSALQRVSDGNGGWKYHLAATKEELTAAPEFKTAEDLRNEVDTNTTSSTTPANPATPATPAQPAQPAQ